MRTIVDIPDHQLVALNRLCEQEKISRAEAVRRALDALLAEMHTQERDSAFGAWAPRGDSSVVVETVRKEWSR